MDRVYNSHSGQWIQCVHWSQSDRQEYFTDLHRRKMGAIEKKLDRLPLSDAIGMLEYLCRTRRRSKKFRRALSDQALTVL